MTKPSSAGEFPEITGLSPETLAQWRWIKKEIPYQIAAE
jgi:hypothetical protein